MLSFLLGLINPIAKITEQIARVRLEAEKAKTDTARINANERIKSLEARRDVLVKSDDGNLNAIVRFLFALPFIAYLWKLVIWDKVLARGTTDPLSSELSYTFMVIVGFYFLHWTIGQLRR